MRPTLASSTSSAGILSFAIAVAVSLASSPARAQTPSAAEQAFRDGRAAVQAGDYATACTKFNESQRLEPAPGTLMNIADCEEHTGKLVAAREHFNLAASGFPRADGRRAFALKHASDLEKRLGHLTLRLEPGAPRDAQVRRGNEIADTSGQPAVVDPGSFDIVVSAPGREDRTYRIDVPEGGTIDQAIEVGPEVVREAPKPAPRADAVTRPETSTDKMRTIGFVVGGVGAASLVTGIVTGVMAAGKASTVKDHCDAAYACDSAGLDAASSGKTLAPISTVTLIAGVALVGAGTYLVIKGRSGRTTAFAPYAAPAGGGAAVTYQF